MKRGLIVLVLGGMLAMALAWFGRPLYQRAMARRLLHAARVASSRHDHAEAGRLYSLALLRKPGDIEILHAYADLLASEHTPRILAVRKLLWQAEPANCAAFFDYVTAAIEFQELGHARNLLRDKAPAEARQNAKYFHLLSVCDFLSGEFSGADAASAEALKRDPNNKILKLDRACIRLTSTNSTEREEARALLVTWLSDPQESFSALHALLLDAAQLPAEATEPTWLKQALERAGRSFSPRGAFYPAYLSALQRWRQTEFESQLWQLTNSDPQSSQDALRRLAGYYLRIENADGLFRVLKEQWNRNPSDPVVTNNFAYISFLTGRESASASRLINELCRQHPDSTAFAATKAFGLLESGDASAGIRLLQQFPLERLQGTPQAVTYGLLLAADKNRDAQEILDGAKSLTHFPQERRLVAESLERLTQ